MAKRDDIARLWFEIRSGYGVIVIIIAVMKHLNMACNIVCKSSGSR